MNTEDLEELPLAPPEAPAKPKLTEEELKLLEKKENAKFRELRMFLREILSKLARNKKYVIYFLFQKGKLIPYPIPFCFCSGLKNLQDQWTRQRFQITWTSLKSQWTLRP